MLGNMIPLWTLELRRVLLRPRGTCGFYLEDLDLVTSRHQKNCSGGLEAGYEF